MIVSRIVLLKMQNHIMGKFVFVIYSYPVATCMNHFSYIFPLFCHVWLTQFLWITLCFVVLSCGFIFASPVLFFNFRIVGLELCFTLCHFAVPVILLCERGLDFVFPEILFRSIIWECCAKRVRYVWRW